MTTNTEVGSSNSETTREELQTSPINGLAPVSHQPVLILIEDIEVDETNPGTLTHSRRDERRLPSMLDSHDILGRVVYPIVVCEHPTLPGKYLHIDGFGRLQMLKGVGAKEVSCFVYPPMSLEQRICFRQTLNAAQEPFDTVSILHDIRLLAEERGLSLERPSDIEILVRDLPARVRRSKNDLLKLTRWDPAVIKRMGEQYGDGREAIGVDQVRSLTRLMDAIEEFHPSAVQKAGGEKKLSVILADLFQKQRFAAGMRSQEGIRKVINAVKSAPTGSTLPSRFLSGEIDLKALISGASEEADKATAGSQPEETSLMAACQELTRLLIVTDAESLSEEARRTLERTQGVLKSLFSAD